MRKSSRDIRAERKASESARWSGFSPLDGDDWMTERDTDRDEYPDPEPEEQQRSALQ